MPRTTDEINAEIDCRCPNNIPIDQWRYWVLGLLGNIAGGIADLSGGGSSAPAPVELVPLHAEAAFGAIAASTGYTAILIDTNPKLYVQFVNSTDEDIILSLNGTTDWTVVPANGGSITLRPGDENKKISGNIFYKKINSPTSGKVIVSAYY